MNKSRYVPLPELDNSRERIHGEITLPGYLDSKKFMVNAGLINFLCRTSGTEVTFVTKREENQLTPTIVGIDESGTAYAGTMASATTEPAFDTKDTGNDSFMQLHAFRRKATTIQINTSEIERKIQTTENNLRDTNVWAAELNNQVKDSVRSSSIHSLLLGLRPVDWTMTALLDIGAAYLYFNRTEADAALMSDFSFLVYSQVMKFFVLHIPFYLFNKFDGTAQENLISFFGPESPKLDRALVVAAVASLSNFVKVDEQELK